MPLIEGKSPRAMSHNIRAEMHAGKPQNQSIAIAYAMKRKAQKHDRKEEEEDHYAKGGMSKYNPDLKGINQQAGYSNRQGESHAGYNVRMAHDIRHNKQPAIADKEEEAKDQERRAKAIHEKNISEMRSMKKPNLYAHGGMSEFEHEEDASGYDHGKLPCPDCESGHCNIHSADMMEHGGDVVERIMHKGLKNMSEGGRIANQEHGPNDDDLADFSRNEFDDLVLRDDLNEHYTGANSGDEIGDEREDEDRRDIVSRAMRSLAKKDRMPIAGYGVSYGRYK